MLETRKVRLNYLAILVSALVYLPCRRCGSRCS